MRSATHEKGPVQWDCETERGDQPGRTVYSQADLNSDRSVDFAKETGLVGGNNQWVTHTTLMNSNDTVQTFPMSSDTTDSLTATLMYEDKSGLSCFSPGAVKGDGILERGSHTDFYPILLCVRKSANIGPAHLRDILAEMAEEAKS